MRCRLDLKSFRKSFAKAGRASSPRSPKVVLQSVLLDASDPHAATLTATDGEVAARVPLGDAAVDAPGRVLLPREITDRILAAATGDVIELESDEASLVVRCGQGRWTLATQDPALFPDAFAQSADPSFVVDAELLSLAIRRTIYACEKEGGSSYALAGISLEWADGRLSAVATDGTRMAYQECECGSIVPPAVCRFHVVPQRLAALVLAAIGDESGPVEVSFPGGSMASFRSAAGTFLGRMLEGRYPEWRRIVPESAPVRVAIDLALLRDAIGQAAATVSETTTGIDLHLSAGMLAVSSPESEVGSGRCEVEVAHAGPPLALTVRPGPLLDALKALDDGPVELAIVGPVEPLGLIRGDFRHYSMPMTRER
jgi:DNA polymerase-3 subunit beta